MLKLLLLITSCNLCCGYKLLLVFPFPSPSHSILGEGYVRNLLKAGHEVTYITPYPIKNATKQLRQIEVMNNTKLVDGVSNFTNHLNRKYDMNDPHTVLNLILKITDATLMHKNVQKLLSDDKENFDAVIAEWMYSEVYAGFSSVYNCPMIWSSPVEPNAFVLMLLNELPNAYTALLTSTSNQQSPFLRRVAEQFQFLNMKFQRWLLSDKEKSVFNEAFSYAIAKRGGILPSFNVMKSTGSLVLGNSHISTGQTFRLPPNYIQIAGYHIEEKREPLPENLQKMLDINRKGVVYFHMGSILRGNTIPDSIKTAILNVFKKVNRTVIWQFDEILKTPNNVHVFYRVPQQSILAHPNCALFITDGELVSVIEAIYFGVPIIGIPIFGDQFNNINKAVNGGFAKKVDMLNIAALKAAIDDVLLKAKYREKAKQLSLVYKDRPIPPAKELVFWVEHVIRSKGAHHLRCPMVLPWYDTVYLELVIVIVIPITCVCAFIAYLLRRRRIDDDFSFKKYI